MKPKKIHIEIIKLLDGYKLYIEGRQIGSVTPSLYWEALDNEILEAIRHRCPIPEIKEQP